ncbi:histone H1.3-like [Tachyglossus aculeatus]|uniref:histone H1.3-like n=1 Tax=Tachyglossus aculeatus TaxID=9261 RepID=UPI0018F37B3F|nr:histone H1.3-like [Tachyglossus aculeatus]
MAEQRRSDADLTAASGSRRGPAPSSPPVRDRRAALPLSQVLLRAIAAAPGRRGLSLARLRKEFQDAGYHVRRAAESSDSNGALLRINGRGVSGTYRVCQGPNPSITLQSTETGGEAQRRARAKPRGEAEGQGSGQARGRAKPPGPRGHQKARAEARVKAKRRRAKPRSTPTAPSRPKAKGKGSPNHRKPRRKQTPQKRKTPAPARGSRSRCKEAPRKRSAPTGLRSNVARGNALQKGPKRARGAHRHSESR